MAIPKKNARTTQSRLYDADLYDGIARDVCLHMVWKLEILQKLTNDPVRIARLKQSRAEWQEAADRAPEVGTLLSEKEIKSRRKRLGQST